MTIHFFFQIYNFNKLGGGLNFSSEDILVSLHGNIY